MKWIIKCFKNYGNFHGRARRKEFFTFFVFIILLLFSVIYADLKLRFDISVYIGISIIFICPTYSVAIRRLHDMGKKEILAIFSILPIYICFLFCAKYTLPRILVLSFIILANVLLYKKEGQPEENEYGPNPKEFELYDSNF